ncbi:hypothetical protein [Aromatoleum petrolei]|uniref:Superoxide dismutase family protein n=1 Tax=Aromatoleum petrolei TaxID=76116 RepID=A0ABX1MY17_9RHOO|nr:hypothetical protein [Aromatoleum petrolei]NMF91196.1 hypothetical protein [Aromatoleum petrolei]QTQ35454.1 Uncharacterized protein ToN1_12900 [Aromatoleum petrolei]
MGKNRFTPGVALLAVLAGCAGTGAGREMQGAAAGEILHVPLTATRHNTGRIGSAMLVSHGGDTTVTLQLSNVPSHATRPIHLYTYIHGGRCEAMSERPAYELTDHVLASPLGWPGAIAAYRGPVTLTNVAPVSLGKLRETPHAINVLTAPADGGLSIFCGNIAG